MSEPNPLQPDELMGNSPPHDEPPSKKMCFGPDGDDGKQDEGESASGHAFSLQRDVPDPCQLDRDMQQRMDSPGSPQPGCSLHLTRDNRGASSTAAEVRLSQDDDDEAECRAFEENQRLKSGDGTATLPEVLDFVDQKKERRDRQTTRFKLPNSERLVLPQRPFSDEDQFLFTNNIAVSPNRYARHKTFIDNFKKEYLGLEEVQIKMECITQFVREANELAESRQRMVVDYLNHIRSRRHRLEDAIRSEPELIEAFANPEKGRNIVNPRVQEEAEEMVDEIEEDRKNFSNYTKKSHWLFCFPLRSSDKTTQKKDSYKKKSKEACKDPKRQIHNPKDLDPDEDYDPDTSTRLFPRSSGSDYQPAEVFQP